MKTMSMVSLMLFFFIGISISMLTYQSNSHQQIFAQSSMTNMEEEKLSAKKNNNNFIIKISTEEGTDTDDGLSNQDLCNKYLEQEGCEISGSTTITTTEQNVTQRLEEKLLEGKPESVPASPPPSPPSPPPIPFEGKPESVPASPPPSPTIPFESFSNDSFSISDTQLDLNNTGQFSNGSMGNVSQ
jgi:hypothetical protein